MSSIEQARSRTDFSIAPTIIVIVSMAIAAIAPFDVAFAAATLGSPVLRAVMIAAIALIGLWSAKRAGLPLSGKAGAVPAGIIGAVLVAAYVVAIDCYLFRSALAVSYVQYFEHTPLAQRLTYFMLRAFNENVIYRLSVFSTALLLLSQMMKVTAATLPFAAVLLVMIISQSINIGVNVAAISDDPITLLTFLYDTLRYIVPGVVWAWLFQRFGFAAAEIASVGCHLFLQPALGALL